MKERDVSSNDETKESSSDWFLGFKRIPKIIKTRMRRKKWKMKKILKDKTMKHFFYIYKLSSQNLILKKVIQ
jgi:hypothetical protein